MCTRRALILGAGSALLTAALPVSAADDRLLADILAGVTDALIRDYIRDHYRDGRWDGRHWWVGDRRYTPYEYRRYWIDRYHRRHHKPPKHWDKPHWHRPPGHRPPPPWAHGRPHRYRDRDWD